MCVIFGVVGEERLVACSFAAYLVHVLMLHAYMHLRPSRLHLLLLTSQIVEVEKVYFKKVKKYIDVPVEVEVIKEVPQPYERVVYVEVPVETIVWRDVPASIEPTEGRVISKEVRVPVEVIREVLVPVEKVVEKEIQVPVEVRTYAESRRGEAIVRGKHIRT
jgi:hypothetical protein